MRRSMSSSRSGASLMTSSMHASGSGNTAKTDKLVKNSRPVQTFLTKDPVTDRDYSENEGQVNFEVSHINC